MENIKVVSITLDDIPRLQQVACETFSETFAAANTEEDMQQYLEKSFATDKLTEELNNPASQFYFAVLNEAVIGYLKINTGQAQTELKDAGAMEIERIYVLKAYHGKKVGQLLYEKAISIAHSLPVSYVWLGVWEENARAISFYIKNGFVPFDKHVFKLGSDEQTDIMMKKIL